MHNFTVWDKVFVPPNATIDGQEEVFAEGRAMIIPLEDDMQALCATSIVQVIFLDGFLAGLTQYVDTDCLTEIVDAEDHRTV